MLLAGLSTACRYNPVTDPSGTVDGVEYATGANGPSSVTVRGWAYDPSDPTAAIEVTVYVANSTSKVATAIGPEGGLVELPAIGTTVYTEATVTASLTRPDVAAAHPRLGGTHGFEVSVPLGEDASTSSLSAGQKVRATDVVVVARNLGSGSDRLLVARHLSA